MMWLKLAPVAVGALALVGMGWWLVSTVQENERLNLNVATLEQARKEDQEAIRQLMKDQQIKEAALNRRTEMIVGLNERLRKAQNAVKVITKTVVTEVERECLHQPVPAAIVDFMLDNQSPDSENGNS